MNILVFDTETTSVNKPFCYNVGYCIVDTTTRETLVERDFVVEQIWHNLPLFATAYYAEKRPLYIASLRTRKSIMEKWGKIMQILKKDIATYKVESAYAYNSPFDDGVFAMNNDWFRTNNPLETIPIHDIRGYAHHFIVNDDYKKFCDKHGLYTEAGNYSTTAEAMYKYLADDTFVEEHTALADSKIEKDILLECLDRGALIDTDYPVLNSVERIVTKNFKVVDKRNGTEHDFEYEKIFINKEKTKAILR